jgi:hypothetical protein
MSLSLTRFMFRVSGFLVRPEHARNAKMSPDRVDRVLSTVGQPEIASVTGLPLMSTRMMFRILFLRLRTAALRCFEVFADPAAPARCTDFQQIKEHAFRHNVR